MIKTFKKQKWLFLFLSVIFYFVPFLVTAISLISVTVEVSPPEKWTLGICVVAINCIPLLFGLIRMFFAHFPMFNTLAIVFLLLYSFFTMQIFQKYIDVFCWIELAAAIGSIASCFAFGMYKKYKRKADTMKTLKDSGLLAKVGAND